jgi:hypothetical protein
MPGLVEICLLIQKLSEIIPEKAPLVLDFFQNIPD